MLEVGSLQESFTFLLIELFLIVVSSNPWFRTIFNSKSLGNKLIRDLNFLGWDPWEFWKVYSKTKKEVRKHVGWMLGRRASIDPQNRVCPSGSGVSHLSKRLRTTSICQAMALRTSQISRTP